MEYLLGCFKTVPLAGTRVEFLRNRVALSLSQTLSASFAVISNPLWRRTLSTNEASMLLIL